MERQVIFRDNQEQQAIDHNDIQSFARRSFDHLVRDAVTASRRYSGFHTFQSAQTEVTVATGRFYDQMGGVYVRTSSLVQSMVPYLPAAAQRIVTVAAYGVEVETNTLERDFLINADTMQVEPEAVNMTRSRDAVLSFVQGAESADPQPPAIPVTHVAIAYILLDATQVVNIAMLPRNAVVSTEGLDFRTLLLEAFKSAIEPRVSSLASDLADLANQAREGTQRRELLSVFTDLAILKEMQQLPEDYSSYGADQFLDPLQSDWSDSAALGFDAKIEEGLRFPDAAADEGEAKIFAAHDPNASLSNGLLLPKFTSELKISTGEYHSDIALGQYGFQTFELVEKKIRMERIRYGGGIQKNSTPWSTNTHKYAGETAPYWLTDFETWSEEITTKWTDPNLEPWGGHKKKVRTDVYWYDSWTEPYWEMETVEHTIAGAQIYQTLLASNDMWATRIAFHVTSKAASEGIWLTLCETTAGVPDLSKVILHQLHEGDDIVIGRNLISIPPTFLQKGRRYAVVLTSSANHRIGMTEGQNYTDGTFGYTTDGAYFLGDFTRNIMLEIHGAVFASAQVTIELDPLSLSGGIRTIDFLAKMIVPESCDVVLEVRPGGAGGWLPLSQHDATILNGAPPLCHFRVRFIGTRDVHAGIMLAGSRVKISRPKTTFRHVSDEFTLPSASDDITIINTLEGFDDTPHDFAAKLRVGGSTIDADAVVVTLMNEAAKRYQIKSVFLLGAPTSTHRVILEGSTNSAANTYCVSNRIRVAS